MNQVHHAVNLDLEDLAGLITVGHDQIVRLQISHGNRRDHVQVNHTTQVNPNRHQMDLEGHDQKVLALIILADQGHIDHQVVHIDPDLSQLHRIGRDRALKVIQ